MKILVPTLAVLLFTAGAISAQAYAAVAPASFTSSSPSAPVLALAPVPTVDTLGNNLAAGSAAHFAQFDTARSLPISPAMVVTLIGLFIFSLRLMGLRQAHALAEHERDSHHGRAQMFRSLHEERSSRR